MSTIIELVSFKLKDNAGVSDFIHASQEISIWVQQQTGFISRNLCLSEDGVWRDIVMWTSVEHAHQAAEKFMQELCQSSFMDMIDGDTVNMSHSAVQVAA
jgi:hypothetical protein